jgi:hypothetical protein
MNQNADTYCSGSSHFEPSSLAINLETCDDKELAELQQAYADLSEFCRLTIEARHDRLRGAIEGASYLEHKADELYNDLPPAFRW